MRTPANAERAFRLGATLEESLYRRWPDFAAVLAEDMGGYPTSTLHGGGRSGGGPSDPTGRQAVDPRSDPARLDAAEAALALRHAGQLFVHLDELMATVLDVEPLGYPLPERVRTTVDARSTLDVIGYVIERARVRWRDFDRAARDTLDRSEGYANLDQAIEVLGQVDSIMCRPEWLGGDPIRLRCQNAKGCPDGNPPRMDSHRCWACGKHLTRYGEERTKVEPPVEATEPVVEILEFAS